MRRVSAKFIPHVLAAEEEGGNPPPHCTFAQTVCEKTEPDGRNAAAIFTVELKIISMAEKQLGAR